MHSKEFSFYRYRRELHGRGKCSAIQAGALEKQKI